VTVHLLVNCYIMPLNVLPQSIAKRYLVNCHREVLSGCRLTEAVGWDGRYMRQEWARSARGVGWRVVKTRDKSDDLGVDVKIILKWVFIKLRRRAWTEFLSLSLVTSGGLWWTRIIRFGEQSVI